MAPQKKTILVIGGTGAQGSAVVKGEGGVITHARDKNSLGK
jgi:hypothetical protein